jgi:sulfur-oxidizing protein SoxX
MKAVIYIFLAGIAATWSFAHASSVMVRDPGLIPYIIVDEVSIPKSLTGVDGDAVKGRKLAINRKKGNCLACHSMPIPEQQFHGETGPSLYGVGNRLSEGELRMQIVNSKVTNEDTMMPAFYRTFGYNSPLKKFVGKTILSTQEVEDIVAYLLTLKTEQ